MWVKWPDLNPSLIRELFKSVLRFDYKIKRISELLLLFRVMELKTLNCSVCRKQFEHDSKLDSSIYVGNLQHDFTNFNLIFRNVFLSLDEFINHTNLHN
jgi:hypothetical protein